MQPYWKRLLRWQGSVPDGLLSILQADARQAIRGASGELKDAHAKFIDDPHHTHTMMSKFSHGSNLSAETQVVIFVITIVIAMGIAYVLSPSRANTQA